MSQKFTDAQLAHFKSFKRVQDSRRYNMITADARRAASLTQEEHIFVIDNYKALAAAVAEKEKTK